MLYNLHLLRVIAALGVVYFHTTSQAGLGLDWDVGSRGVDVFFVISGFIIAYIGTTKPDHFLLRRVIRVVPFYWAATLALFALVSVAPHLFRTTQADVTHLAYSLAFLPHEGPDGSMWPTLVLGWSLEYEMFFYLVFAMALRISQRYSPMITTGWIVGFVLAITLFAGGHPITSFYARPIVLEFCMGIAAFYVFTWCDARAPRLRAFAAGAWILGAVAIASLVAIAVLEQLYRDSISRVVIAGLPSFALVTAVLLLERVYGVLTRSKAIFVLGEASYIIYLVHPYIVYAVLRVVVPDAASLSSPVLALIIVGLLGFVSAISVAVHLVFEKPVMAYLRARLI
ncbi:MAG TPA: acyltransferase [Kofleriaceae bacterium]|nr:acyltransferase [Kofleriaceae bacterium]